MRLCLLVPGGLAGLRLTILFLQSSQGDMNSIVPAGSRVEITLIEARDLVAADWAGTSDPYVSVRYGNIKKRTKVCTPPNKTLVVDRSIVVIIALGAKVGT
jgi:Ca2+-dependent lipid-binding protein